MKVRQRLQKHSPVLLLASLIIILTFACNFPNLQPAEATDVPGFSTIIPEVSTSQPGTLSTPSSGLTNIVDESQLFIPTDAYQLWDRMPYTVQAGDTLPALTARFRTTIENIAADNPSLPSAGKLTTLAPGQVLSIRLVVDPFWDEGVVILPNSLYVNGPATLDFDAASFLAASNGWLKNYIDRSGEKPVTGLQIVESIVNNYSLSPRLILAILEYQLHALSDPVVPASFSLGNLDPDRRTLGRQLSWAANILNNGYYGWRKGSLTQYTSLSGFMVNPNPWQNAATVAIQYYFSRFLPQSEYDLGITQNNFLQTYQSLFGSFSWKSDFDESFIPANLEQPAMGLPFQSGLRWSLTAGPHSGWGTGFPWAAIDFAPPAETAGCTPSEHWAVAMTGGIITRSEDGLVVQDLDGDGNSQTGWVILYLHIFPDGAAGVGDRLEKGDLIGHPSCTGGQSTGRNLHIARLYNGEWIPAGAEIPFNMDGWVMAEGIMDYKGSLSRGSHTVYPSSIGIWASQLTADP